MHQGNPTFATKTTQNQNTHPQGNNLKHISLMIGRALCNVLGHSPCNEKKKEISKLLKEMSLYNLKFPNEISLKGKACTKVQGLYLALGFLGFPQVGWNLAVQQLPCFVSSSKLLYHGFSSGFPRFGMVVHAVGRLKKEKHQC